jgi:hypothetical protein
MIQENRLRVFAWELAEDRRVDQQELRSLQQRAMRAAKAYGCEAGIEVMDFVASDPPDSLRLKIVVAWRTRQDELLWHESIVVLMTNGLAASVEQIVRDVAKLAMRAAPRGVPAEAAPRAAQSLSVERLPAAAVDQPAGPSG